MKLTKTMREAFVRAVMQDVPSVDYEEKARSIINSKAAATLEAAGLSNVDHERLEGVTVYGASSTDRYALSIYVRGLTKAERSAIQSDPEVKALLDKAEAQSKERNILEKKADGCHQRLHHPQASR